MAASLTSEPVLRCEKLVAGYARPVVGPLSFDLHPGEVLGLLGSNGAGKSTVLKAITGVARVLGGSIRKRPGLRLAHHRQLPVRPHEFPLTGEDLVRLTGAVHRNPPDEVSRLLHCRMDQLSGGQFQLVQIWACLGSPADLVLLDEPTNNLDPATNAVLSRLIREERGGRTLLLVSHDASFIEAVCSRSFPVDS
jgi:ABC-2 type transport system ATP-binding protein